MADEHPRWLVIEPFYLKDRPRVVYKKNSYVIGSNPKLEQDYQSLEASGFLKFIDFVPYPEGKQKR